MLAPVSHRPATVQQDQCPQVCLLVVLFHIRAIGAAKQSPVQSPRLVAGDVNPLLAERAALWPSAPRAVAPRPSSPPPRLAPPQPLSPAPSQRPPAPLPNRLEASAVPANPPPPAP